MYNPGLEYSINGVIRDSESGMPVQKVKVRAYDKDFFREQLLGDGMTDENGAYRITFCREDFTGPMIQLERNPDIFVLVLDEQDRMLYSTENSIIVDAARQNSLDLAVKTTTTPSMGTSTSALFGIRIDLPEVAKLSAEEVVSAYRLMRNPYLKVENAERIKKAFPGIFQTETQSPPECGNGVRELFQYLLRERDADVLLDDADADPFSGATVKQFFTANIVVKYTVATTLPDGSANPNALPAASAALPGADSNYNMPGGTLIGVIRTNLADLHADNTEVAPTYIQKVGLLAEYSLSRFINPPFAYRDPRGGMSRLEFRILNLGTGVAGYAVSSDFHMELNTANNDAQNLGTVPHELFHLVQYRYNAGAAPANSVRGIVMEGGARLLEESINETPNRYIESARDPDLSTAPVPRKGLLTFPEEGLIDPSGSQSLLRYAAGLLWKYMAEQHSTLTGTTDEPAIGVDSYRKIIERMTSALDHFTAAAIRNGRGLLPWYGSFDQFAYLDTAATELSSHETTWANFLLANYHHRLWTSASAGFDARYDYKEDDDPAGNVAPLNTYSAAVQPGNVITIAQGTAITRIVMAHKPYAAVYYELNPSATSAPRMLRVSFTASGGMSDPIVQIVRIGAGNTLVDIHRSDRTAYAKTINMAGLTRVLVIVGSKENGGNFTLNLDEVASASDVMVTRWNSAVGREYEIDPRGWSWTWISPDIMVDTNNDLLDDTDVFFGVDNKLKIRLRNRGNTAASSIQIDFWYQKATGMLSSASWIPVQNAAGVTQSLTGLSLAAGAEQWFGVDWCPVDDGTHANHWCVKVLVTCASDPNRDNKMSFRNFVNLAITSPDYSFASLIRFGEWTHQDRVMVVSRNRRWNFKLLNAGDFPRNGRKESSTDCGPRITFGTPLDMRTAKFKLVRSRLRAWDGRITGQPQDTHAFYPVDESTLPPGVKPEEIITMVHIRNGLPFGGISYRIQPTGPD